MAENMRNSNGMVDDAGIRLAPAPVCRDVSVSMPAVRQEFVITPQLKPETPNNGEEQTAKVTTEHDYQPKKKDVSKKWKRSRRSKNIALGVVMFILSAVILLQYILGAANVRINNLKFALIPDELGAIANIVNAVKLCMKFGWTTAAAKQIWLNCVPSFILIVGLIAVAVNMIKSIVGLFGAVKPRKYMLPALVYLLMALAVLIIYLVGAPTIGVEQVDFMKDVIYGYQTSELFGIIVFALGYFIASVICTWISSEKYGYLK